MGDKPTPEKFFDQMGDVVSKQRDKLLTDGGVPGTDLGRPELGALSVDMKSFKESCLPVLANDQTCTGTFNTMTGKTLLVAVSYDKGVEVEIRKPEAVAVTVFGKTLKEAEPARMRKVSFQPPGQ